MSDGKPLTDIDAHQRWTAHQFLILCVKVGSRMDSQEEQRSLFACGGVNRRTWLARGGISILGVLGKTLDEVGGFECFGQSKSIQPELSWLLAVSEHIRHRRCGWRDKCGYEALDIYKGERTHSSYPADTQFVTSSRLQLIQQVPGLDTSRRLFSWKGHGQLHMQRRSVERQYVETQII